MLMLGVIQMNMLFNNPFIAHRGIYDNITIAENSITAFNNAIKQNYAIELDVQLTADNVPVVFHDRNLKRMTGVSGDITKMTLNEINELSLLSTNEHIMTLDETLRFINNRVGVLIDLKIESFNYRQLNDIVKILNQYNGEYAVQSFNVLAIKWLRKKYSNINSGVLISKFENDLFNPPRLFFKKMALKLVDVIKFCNPCFLSYERNLLPNKKANHYLKLGYPILAWTIKSQKEYEKVKPYCTNIIFENFIP